MFDKEMQAALIADGEKLTALTGEDHGPYFLYDDDVKCVNAHDRCCGGAGGPCPYCERPVVAPQQPRAADAFRNMFAILHNLETSDLPFMSAEQRRVFFNDPCVAILRLDDARLGALYNLVQSRQPERYRSEGGVA